MGDPANTPAHRQQCGDTIIIVNMPAIKTSGVQYVPQYSSNRHTGRATGIAPTSQHHPTTVASEHQQETTNAQRYAKVQPDASMPARHNNSADVDRTALAQRGTSPVEEMSLDASQITSSADGYFSRENIRRVHGSISATSKRAGHSLPTRRHVGQHDGFTTPPPTLPQTKLDFSEDEATNSMDASDSCYFNRKVGGHPSVTSVSIGGNVYISNGRPLKKTLTGTASSNTGHCLVSAVASPTDQRILVNIGNPSQTAVIRSSNHVPLNSSQPRHICVVATGTRPQVTMATSRYHRPQYSYLHLIQMAISSSPEKQMTLKQIYHWIEDNFPYYGYTSNQGWKNSIRHNLSLYDVFVRKKPSSDSKKRTSYWTLCVDVPLNSAKSSRQQLTSGHSTSAASSSSGRVHPSAAVKNVTPPTTVSTSRQKKGPVPLLPKVSPMQAFALIPIQGGVLSPPPFILPSWSVGSSRLAPVVSVPSAVPDLSPGIQQSFTSLKRNLEPSGEPCKKQVKIAPKSDQFGATRSASYSVDICGTPSASEVQPIGGAIRSAFTPCHNSSTDHAKSHTQSPSRLQKSLRLRSASATELSPRMVAARCHVTPRIMRQRRGSLSGVASNQSLFDDSGIDLLCQKTDSSVSSSLPRPRMYRRKCSHSGTMYESQPDGAVDINVADVVGERSTRRRNRSESLADAAVLTQTPNRKTSTPFKESVCSPSWISPIKEFTPLSDITSHFDSGCFFTPDSASKSLSSLPCRVDVADIFGSPQLHHGTSPKSPKLGSLRGLGMPGLTPLKSSVLLRSPNSNWAGGLNHSFNQLFDDCHLNSIMNDELNMDFSFSPLL